MITQMTCSTKLALPDAPRLLIARPDRVGDVIISTSCIMPIRQSFPRCSLYFYAADRMRPLLENHPNLDGFVSDPSRLGPLHLDAVIHLHPDPACYRSACDANVPVRIGYEQRSLTKYLTHPLPDRRSEGVKHEAAYSFDLLNFHALIVANPGRDKKPTVGFRARFFSAVSSTALYGYVEFAETLIAKHAFFCRRKGQKLPSVTQVASV